MRDWIQAFGKNHLETTIQQPVSMFILLGKVIKYMAMAT